MRKIKYNYAACQWLSNERALEISACSRESRAANSATMTSSSGDNLMQPSGKQQDSKPTNRRHLNTFRRQLVAAFSSSPPSAERRRHKLSINNKQNSKCSLAEVDDDDDDHFDQLDELAERRLRFRSSELSSPSHLIRMLAERRREDTSEQFAAPSSCSFVSFIIETPTKAANCFNIARFKPETTSTPLNQLNLSPETINATSNNKTTINEPPNQTTTTQNASSKSATRPACELARLMEFLAQEDDELKSIRHYDSPLDKLIRCHDEDDDVQDDDSLRFQQDAIWELVDTERHYINNLRLIIDLFLATLERIQARTGLLAELRPHQIASNIDQLLAANLALWSGSCATSGRQQLDPSQFKQAFTSIGATLKPYYRFCLEQASCVRRLRKLSGAGECFRYYLSWCEARPECGRQKLADLLACPMQRLTRYSLLLRTIQRRTLDAAQRLALGEMLACTDKFVHSVDWELKRRDEYLKLAAISARVQLLAAAAGPPPGGAASDAQTNSKDQAAQIASLLERHSAHFDLMRPLFVDSCSCPRQLLFDSSTSYTRDRTSDQSNSFDSTGGRPSSWPPIELGRLKFRDVQCCVAQQTSSSKTLDVVLLIFTDQLLVCKPQEAHTSNWSRHRWYERSVNRKRSFRFAGRSTNRGGRACASNSNLCAQSLDRAPSSPVAEPIKLNVDLKLTTQKQEPNSPKFRRRAVSHSFAYMDNATAAKAGANLLTVAASQSAATTELFLTPARALALPSDGESSSGAQIARQRYLSRSSQQLSSTSTQMSSRDNSSNCSLASNQTPPTRVNQPNSAGSPSHSLINAPTLNGLTVDMRDYAQLGSSCGDLRARRRGGPSAPVALRALHSPYPIERLVVHELADGQSVLVCQLNEHSRTVASSFVLHSDELKRSLKRTQSRDSTEINATATTTPSTTTPARYLRRLVEEAQVRYATQARLHDKCVPIVRSDNCESTTSERISARRRRLKLIAEQHQLFLLNHGRHEELATNDFEYKLSDDADSFTVLPRPLNSLKSATRPPSPSTSLSSAATPPEGPPTPTLIKSTATSINSSSCATTTRSRRVNLSSLRRQNVVLSASGEQQSNWSAQQLDKRLLYASDKFPSLRRATQNFGESSSIDSAGLSTSLTDENATTTRFHKMHKQHELLSSSMQASTIDNQTFEDDDDDDDDENELPANQSDEDDKLLLSDHRSKPLGAQQSPPSIAVTLTVPPPTCSSFSPPPTPPTQSPSVSEQTLNNTNEVETSLGCLDLRSPVRLLTGNRNRSRSIGARVQTFIRAHLRKHQRGGGHDDS